MSMPTTWESAWNSKDLFQLWVTKFRRSVVERFLQNPCWRSDGSFSFQYFSTFDLVRVSINLLTTGNCPKVCSRVLESLLTTKLYTRSFPAVWKDIFVVRNLKRSPRYMGKFGRALFKVYCWYPGWVPFCYRVYEGILNSIT